MDKSLSDKAIDLKGKKYVLVSDRVIFFNENYDNGSITTEMITEPGSDMVIFKATVLQNGVVLATGHSQSTWGDGFVNKTSALENAETSAVGRALAFLGIGVIDSIASIDEIKKTTLSKGKQKPTKEQWFDAIKQLREKVAAGGEVNKINATKYFEGSDYVEEVQELLKNYDL